MHYIVVHDPRGEFFEGSLIDAERAEMLAARGVVALAVDPELFRLSGIGGFYKRAWGAGWPLNSNVPRFHCPVTLFVTRQHHSLSWAARLVPDPTMGEEQRQYGGLIRLTADSAQPTALQGGFVANESRDRNMIDVSMLGEPDEDWGWTVRGEGRLNSSGEGFLALGLYGNAPGLAIQWLAVGLAH